jgi:hypothetical protein
LNQCSRQILDSFKKLLIYTMNTRHRGPIRGQCTIDYRVHKIFTSHPGAMGAGQTSYQPSLSSPSLSAERRTLDGPATGTAVTPVVEARDVSSTVPNVSRSGSKIKRLMNLGDFVRFVPENDTSTHLDCFAGSGWLRRKLLSLVSTAPQYLLSVDSEISFR